MRMCKLFVVTVAVLSLHGLVENARAGTPVGVHDYYYEVNEDDTLFIAAPGVMSNDIVEEGDLVTMNETYNLHGELALSEDGSFTYTPEPNFNYLSETNYGGFDWFIYQPFNEGSLGIAAIAYIKVNPVNDPPEARDDQYAMNDTDGVLNVYGPGVLANDNDIDGDSPQFWYIEGPYNGTLEMDGDGGFRYFPNDGYTGEDNFFYQLSDGQEGYSQYATVTITIRSSNGLPQAANDAYTMNENEVLSVPAPGVLANDSDPDDDSLTVGAIVANPRYGRVTMNKDGSFTYRPNANYHGSDSFTYWNSDGKAGSTTARVTITIRPVNRPPVATDDAYTMDEDGTLNVAAPGVLGNDSDPDGDPLSAALIAGPQHGTLTLNAAGSFDYKPEANYHGADSFTCKASDGQLDSKPATVTITVNSVNDPPVLGPITGLTGPVNISNPVMVGCTFTDSDSGDTHNAVWNWGDGTTSPGTVYELTGSIIGSHTYLQAGIYTIRLEITDAAGARDAEEYAGLVVYNPNAGFVTGGGWINSPAGAYPQYPTMSGKTEITFNLRYLPGSNTPTGQLVCHFNAAKMKYQATSFDWLLITGDKARYQGEGTINGGSQYGFMVTLIDDRQGGRDRADMIGIRIWNKDTGQVVFDNEPGVAAGQDPATPLGGGSITIHK